MSINGQVTLTTDNFELGANKAPVPATGNFLAPTIGAPESTGGPTLLGAVPTPPANAQPIEQGVVGHGNLAVTDPDGNLNLQDVGVYADPDIGIRDDFIEKVKAQVTEGTSCLFLMTASATEDKVVEAMKQHKFEIISTNLSKEHEDALRVAFAG